MIRYQQKRIEKGQRWDNAMEFFDGMMTEIKQMKWEHSEQIAQLDNDIHDYI